MGRPEVPTTAHWRMSMRTAREKAGMTQAELGRRTGVSQNVISKIETGEQEASESIVDICKVLGISMPFALFSDELDERWFQVGMLLRQRNENFFRTQLKAMETFAAELASDDRTDA